MAADTVPLGRVVRPREAESEFARPMADRSAVDSPLVIAGRTYSDGLGVQAESTVSVDVNGAARFTALAGVDDATEGAGGVVFSVEADGRTLWRSGELRKGAPPVAVDVDLRGRTELRLHLEDVGWAQSRVLGDWAEARFEFSGAAPASKAFVPFAEDAVILTPKPRPEPRINSARVFGVRPGHPLLYTIAATGERPMRFAAEGLPDGVSLDPASRRITGTVTVPGTHRVKLRATNARGAAEAQLRLEVGERIALTPALGWNSWNCWAEAVDQDKVLRSAKAMVARGLADHGWSYVNIDDTWQGARAGRGKALLPNEKFPDMKGLAEAVHALGLKIGIYSTPWITSYANHAGGSSDDPEGAWVRTVDKREGRRLGRHSFALADARQWAAWGIDYLKYDWNPNLVAAVSEMGSALRTSGRDIVYSLSNDTPFALIGENSHLANSWRTTGDIVDTWGSVQRIGFSQGPWRPFGGPGHWNDPDMLVVGWVGWGPKLHPARLTPNEQYTHITLWCLLSAPLLIGCALERLDDFTINLLTNDEVLEVDQDPLGEPAAQEVDEGRRQVWAKRMEDGSRAIGLFNLSREPDVIGVRWSQLGLKGPQRVRDLWRQQDLGVREDGFSAEVPRHGAILIRVWPESSPRGRPGTNASAGASP